MKVFITTILGLEIGVGSVGFALISRHADGRQVRILRMGVQVFPEGRTEDKKNRAIWNGARHACAAGNYAAADNWATP